MLQLEDASGFPRLSGALPRELLHVIEFFRQDETLAGAVLTGTEKCFAAGAEITEIAELDGLEATRFAARGQSVMRAIELSAKPVVAAIRGYCMGGGFDLALACHARIASSDAMFAHRGASLGLITGWGGTQRLTRVLGPSGRSLTLEWMTTGRSISAQEAYDVGLVSRIVPAQEVTEAAIAWVTDRRGGAPT